jgi:hypothetical protein
MKRLLLILAVLVLVSSVSLAETRTWKSSNGRFSVKAELVECKDGKASLKKEDGSIANVPLASLCDDDRQYIKSQFPDAVDEKPAAGGEYREWKSKNGKFKTAARFVGCAEGKVQLRKPDGSEVSVNKSLLSEADQRWIAAELKRQGKEEKESAASDAEPSGKSPEKIGEGEIPMKLVRLDMPKPSARGRAAAPSLFSQIRPQQISVKLGQDDAAFHRVVTKEPSYNSSKPIRGVVKFASHEYGFAIDSTGGGGAYNRFYFDINGNGDLTDDKPVAATTTNTPIPGFSQSLFARVNLSLEAGGKSFDYAFVPSVVCSTSGRDSFATVAFTAAAVREATVGKGAKGLKLVLVDHNSNGLFDDAVSVRPGGAVVEGDLLVVSSMAGKSGSDADPGQNSVLVNKTVGINGAFYKMDAPPSGETLKLTPISAPMGSVVSSSPTYHAVLFSEEYGAVAVNGVKGKEQPLPEGSWKVLNYTVKASGGKTFMSARFDGQSKPTAVKKGEKSELPFGAPLHAVVTAQRAGADKVFLSLSILGVGGERCTSLTVNGAQPPKPKFSITDKDGKEVLKGDFKWG